jgi:hypothetical protein
MRDDGDHLTLEQRGWIPDGCGWDGFQIVLEPHQAVIMDDDLPSSDESRPIIVEIPFGKIHPVYRNRSPEACGMMVAR